MLVKSRLVKNKTERYILAESYQFHLYMDLH